jgi:hypothetical protein
VSRSRSSIFSFDTLRLNGRAPAGFFRAALLALALSIAAEGTARMVIPAEGPRDEYWSRGAAVKFETYRERANAGRTPAVLVVGDSTAARDFDPVAIAESTGLDAYNLAWPGNFPLAFRCTTIPLLASASNVPRVVVASFTPNGFSDTERIQRFEAGIVTSDICRRAAGDRIPADFIRLTLLGRTLARGDSKEPDMTATELGFMPLEGRSQEASRREDRARREKDDVRSITAERFEVVRELGRIARERGFTLVVVVPPVAPKERDGNVYAEYTRALGQASADLGFTVIDWRHPEGYGRESFYDSVHLNAEAARRFSLELGRVVRETISR